MLPIVLAIVCLGTTTFAASALGIAAFPVQASADQRYLVDQNGVPFPIMGRTAWFITSVSVTDYHTFVDDTAMRGYNAIELHVVNHDPRGNNPPFNGNNDLPFLNRLDGATWDGSLKYGDINNEAPDFTTPNEAYWSFVDGLFSYCETKGILVFMFPAYVGSAGGNQGWMQEMVANGTTKMQSYGGWIATRYQNQKNLVWMMGGDMGTPPNPFNPAQATVERALLTGLESVTGQQSLFFSAEWTSESIATDQVTFGPAMTLNGAYSWSGDVNNQGRRAYDHTPVEPAFLLEGPYDEEGPDGNNYNPSATQPVRRFQWWGWLSTTGGYISGNGYVWPFRVPDWHDHLDTQGSRDMTRLNAFMGSITWSNLVPSNLSGMRNLITAGGSVVSASDYVAAAATFDGTLLVAYIPPDHSGSITVDMTAMSGPARARWFDPTSAAYFDIGTGLPNIGTRVFTPPGNNSAGEADWVLTIDTATVAPTPTPTPPPVSVSGTVLYCSNPIPGPVPSVTLTLTGDVTASAMTDDSGNYQFSSLASGGTYTVTPSMAARTPGSAGINTIDVIATQRHFLNLGTPLTGCRLTAADVNGIGGVNTVDVVAVQRFFLGQTTGIANVGKYQFNPVNRSYTPLVGNQTDQNYDTIIFGDVAPGFVHRPEGPSQDALGDDMMSASEVPSTVAAVALPEVAVNQLRTPSRVQLKSNFIAAVRSSEIDAKNKLVGFQGDFTFDERVVTFQSEPAQKAGLTGGNWKVSGNVLPGAGPIRTLRISAYSNDFTPLSGSGTLFKLRLTRVSQAAQGTLLLWAASPNEFIFIDADLNTQKPGNAAPGRVTPSGKRK